MTPFSVATTARATQRFRNRLMLAPLVIAIISVAIVLAPTQAEAVGPTLPPAGATPATTKPAASAPAAAPAAAAKQAPKRAASKKATSKKASTQKTAKKTGKVSGLSQGARGEKVKALQQRLIELHYDVTDVEGQFGDQTYHAVLAFQKANRLNRTGAANSQTLAALETATDPEPMMPNGGASRVEVDLKRQVLLLWENGELYRIISISSGSGKDFCSLDPETNKTECDVAVTPTGSFRVTRRWVGWRESKLGEMYNPLYFSGGFAIHGSLSVPGYPASHGCIRVPMVSAEWLPSIIEDGTAVYVFGAKDTDKTPTPLKYTGTPPTTTNGSGTAAPTSSTIPSGGGSPSTPPTSGATTTTSTVPPTTLVRLLGGSTTPTPSAAPSTAPLATAPTSTSTTAPAVTVRSSTTPSSLLPLPVG